MTTPHLTVQELRELADLLWLEVDSAGESEFSVNASQFGEFKQLFRGTLERCSDFIRGFCAARENP